VGGPPPILDLYNAELQVVGLSGAQLQGANLSSAQLQGANLSGAQLQGALVWGVRMSGALASEATGWPDGWDRATTLSRGVKSPAIPVLDNMPPPPRPPGEE
jgi:hypothetical protein